MRPCLLPIGTSSSGRIVWPRRQRPPSKASTIFFAFADGIAFAVNVVDMRERMADDVVLYVNAAHTANVNSLSRAGKSWTPSIDAERTPEHELLHFRQAVMEHSGSAQTVNLANSHAIRVIVRRLSVENDDRVLAIALSIPLEPEPPAE